MLSTVYKESSVDEQSEFDSYEQSPTCSNQLPEEGTHDEDVTSNASDSSVGSNIEDLLEKEPSPIRNRGRIHKIQNPNSILVGCGEVLSDISEGSDVMDLDNDEEDEEHDFNSLTSRFEDLNESSNSISTTISVSSDIEEDFDDAILRPFINALKLEDDVVCGPHTDTTCHMKNSAEESPFSINKGRPLKRPAEESCITVKRFKLLCDEDMVD